MSKNTIIIAGAIVVAGALIAGSLFFSNDSGSKNPTNNENTESNIRLVEKNDHIRGERDAKIVVVEYSDFECPFCKRFDTTMKQIVKEYEGQVAWVYRHFPLTQIHPNAPRLAEASECVADLEGNDAFWNFVDGVFEIAPEGEFFPMDQLDTLAGDIGVDVADFNACLDSGKFAERVENDFNEAVANGGRGTPHNVLIVDGKDQVVVEGAQPLESMRAIIDEILAE